MEAATLLVVLPVAGLVLVPLAREYGELREEDGLTRLGAFATTLLVLPALAVGVVVALPLAAVPPAQWTATVVVTLATYSLAVAAVRSAGRARRVPRRSA